METPSAEFRNELCYTLKIGQKKVEHLTMWGRRTYQERRRCPRSRRKRFATVCGGMNVARVRRRANHGFALVKRRPKEESAIKRSRSV